MSIATNGILTAADINALKADVKAEMLRRSHSGSVSSYGGTAYDYTVVPASGGNVLIEHFNKNQIPLAAVNSDAVPSAVVENQPITYADIAALQAEVTLLEAKSLSTSSTGCKSGCTGLCYSGCWNACSGCTGCSGCGYICSYSCSGCSGTCTGTCSGGCSGGCSGSCSGGCYGCSSGCTSCTGCSAACMTACHNRGGIN